MSIVLGLGGGYFHDGSACLIVDGEVVAFVEEERFTRRKQNKGSRSCERSARYCLSVLGASASDIDRVAVAWNPAWPNHPDGEDLRTLAHTMLGGLGAEVPSDRISRFDHHHAHAASAYYCSGAHEAAVIIVDGAGDGVSSSIWHGVGNELRLLRHLPISQSLGWFYEAAAEYVGLGRWSAGKLMGLAAYGSPAIDFPFFDFDDGLYRIDPEVLRIGSDGVGSMGEVFEYVEEMHRALSLAFERLGVPRCIANEAYDHATGRWAAPLPLTSTHRDFAASVQLALERAVLSLVSEAVSDTGSGFVCMAGGVAFNCAANGAVSRAPTVDTLFVQPVAGDAGVALGAAYLGAVELGWEPHTPRLAHVALGPEYRDGDIADLLDDLGVSFRDAGANLEHDVASKLASGEIVAWVQGRMEVGPRALGGRSILADPRTVRSRERVNRRIKRRETWRPLAPSIAVDEIGRWASGVVNPFMIVADQATDEACDRIPAVVHVDGTMRVQAVEPGSRYARLLHEVGEQTGIAAVLNTSFNNESEPIVCSPVDAVRTFFSSELDALVLGSLIVEKDSDTRLI